jgi:8-oxo-dGTP pyrophosphatase MutT (NUDIX family)
MLEAPAPTCPVRGSAVILDAQRRVLLVRQVPHRDFWLLPGGGAEPGEVLRATAVREVGEETGLCIACDRLLWLSESVQGLPGRLVHHIDACYLAHVIGHTGSPAGHEWGLFARDGLPSDEVLLPPDFWSVLDRGFREYDPGGPSSPGRS